ncbi:MAG: UDP-3-O-[3-hydroxymyristoyl] N-acetylglucosamine deacetylase [Gemmatimonadales bacterium]|nr:MAG: UDP-3-O-[3-hydroxymyristoyl] N-acetylglucosamine deacetylase [Gemmatimonadales bacterium]
MIGPTERTVASPVKLSGIGVHSGKAAELEILPGTAGSGLVFFRTDLDGAEPIRAHLDHVQATDLGTTIGLDETNRVLTVEHLMAALHAVGVTTAEIRVSGPEIPILDGSFQRYLEALRAAGVRELGGKVRTVRVRSPLQLETKGGSRYVVTPSSGFRVSTVLEFDHPAIGRQFGSWDLDGDVFESDIAPARTFGFREDGETLKARGRAQGSSLENTVVLDRDGVLNDGLRFPDEFVRHKTGDLVGDLALMGARIEGHIVAERPSHSGNIELARALDLQDRRGGGGEPIVDAQKILQYLPHRYPMLLVDRITHFEAGRRITGIKNVTVNEPFFQGHYPGHPIMPGVLIIEAMAQVGGLLLMDTIENPDEKVVYFMSLNNVKWRRPVTPGDQLVFELELLQFRRSVCKMRGEGFVDGQLVAEAELMARIMDR